MADTPTTNQPASGTYGEKTALEGLKKSLPAGAVGNPPKPGAAPPPVLNPEPINVGQAKMGRPLGGPVPPGVPPMLGAPTTMPGRPVSTPLLTGQGPAMNTPEQGRLAMLDQLANSPDVSESTREWAQIVIKMLLEQ